MPDKNYLISPVAQQDLFDIWDYVSQESPQGAEKVIDKIENVFEMIAFHPEIGHKRRDLTHKPVLFWSVYSYLIIYRHIKGTPVEFVRILSGYRDIVSLLKVD